MLLFTVINKIWSMAVSATICNHHVYLMRWFMFRCRILFAGSRSHNEIQSGITVNDTSNSFLYCLWHWLKSTYEAGRSNRSKQQQVLKGSCEERAKTWELGDVDSLPGAAIKLLCKTRQAIISIVKIKTVRLKYEVLFLMYLIQWSRNLW